MDTIAPHLDRVIRIHDSPPARHLGSTRAGEEHVFVHDITEERAVAEKSVVRFRLRVALRRDHRLVLVHLLARQTEQTET